MRGVRMGLSLLRGLIDDDAHSRSVLRPSGHHPLSLLSSVIVMTVQVEVMLLCVECARAGHRFVDRSTSTSVHVPLSIGASVLDGLFPYSSVVVVAVHGEVMKPCVSCACACHRFVDRSTTVSVRVSFSCPTWMVSPRTHASSSWPSMER